MTLSLLRCGHGRAQVLWLACLPLFVPAVSRAEVRLPSIFADHMVIQRDIPVHLWGMASPEENVTITFRGETGSTTADDLGRWSLFLHPGTAGGPFKLQVQGSGAGSSPESGQASDRIEFDDVLVGDVWIASGQSNMEFPMASGLNRGVDNEQTEIADANYPEIRLLDIQPESSEFPASDVTLRHPWSRCTPASVASFSAVGYFFARDVQLHHHIPIGVIDVTWGGTPAEAWTSLDALSSDASLMPVFARRAKLMDVQVSAALEQQKEKQEHDAATAAGKAVPPLRWHAPPESWRPAGLYNAMIAPLTPFAIKGVIWYQAESNGDADGVPIYGRLFKTMIQDWRQRWGQGDFPFLFVQVANWNPGALWPQLREAQQSALALRNTAMVVTIDIGDPDNIHPKNKQDVGLRLSLAARALAYGEPIESSGPLVRQVTAVGPNGSSGLRVQFDHAGEGLISKNGDLRTFEIAGSNMVFLPAQAKIEDDAVLVTNASVKNPIYVRYGWAPNPNCNLYNSEGLPASPFEASTFHIKDPQ